MKSRWKNKIFQKIIEDSNLYIFLGARGSYLAGNFVDAGFDGAHLQTRYPKCKEQDVPSDFRLESSTLNIRHWHHWMAT